MASDDASSFVMIGHDHQGKYCVLDDIEGFEDDYKLRKGESVAEDWGDDVLFRMAPDFKKQIKLSDHLTNLDSVIVASERLQRLLKDSEVPNVEYLPVTIVNHKKKVASEEYCLVHPVGAQDCIDVAKSEIEWNEIDADDIDSADLLVLDESKIDARVVLFRVKGLTDAIFCARDLMEEMLDAGFTGISSLELSDY